MKQRSDEWYRERLGKLTASEISVLMKDHKEPMTGAELVEWKLENPKSRITTKTVPFSDATYTYLNRKVMEHYLPLTSPSVESRNAVDEYINEHSFSNRATDWGVFWEDTARSRYAAIMGYEVFEVGFVPYDKYPNLAGASPDGLIRQENGGCEIKSPFTMEKHMQHILYESPSDLKENEEEYYWQCYMGMLVTGCEFWDFISFNPFISKSKQLKVLRIFRDEAEIEILKERIDLAVDYFKEQFEKIDNINMIITG